MKTHMPIYLNNPLIPELPVPVEGGCIPPCVSYPDGELQHGIFRGDEELQPGTFRGDEELQPGTFRA